jgi:hypothetical protein
MLVLIGMTLDANKDISWNIKISQYKKKIV